MPQKPQPAAQATLCPTNLTKLAHKLRALSTLPCPQRLCLQCQFDTMLSSVALALTLTHTPQIRAADISVTTNNPVINNADGTCSLIEAINNANDDAATHSDCTAGSGADTLILNAGTYTLNAQHNVSTYASGNIGLPQISSVISIAGNGATIERSATAMAEFRLFQVNSNAHLTLEQTTVSGALALNLAAASIMRVRLRSAIARLVAI